MSGGRFDYIERRIPYIAESIQAEIDNNNTKWDGIFSETEWKGERYTKETIEEFKNGIEALRKAYVYARRIDYLLSGDDGEEAFHRRLQEELENFNFSSYQYGNAY